MSYALKSGLLQALKKDCGVSSVTEFVPKDVVEDDGIVWFALTIDPKRSLQISDIRLRVNTKLDIIMVCQGGAGRPGRNASDISRIVADILLFGIKAEKRA